MYELTIQYFILLYIILCKLTLVIRFIIVIISLFHAMSCFFYHILSFKKLYVLQTENCFLLLLGLMDYKVFRYYIIIETPTF